MTDQNRTKMGTGVNATKSLLETKTLESWLILHNQAFSGCEMIAFRLLPCSGNWWPDTSHRVILNAFSFSFMTAITMPCNHNVSGWFIWIINLRHISPSNNTSSLNPNQSPRDICATLWLSNSLLWEVDCDRHGGVHFAFHESHNGTSWWHWLLAFASYELITFSRISMIS